MTKVKIGKKYVGSLSASIDWVAGGNFDGYVYRSTLQFYEDGQVDKRIVVLHQAHYDGTKQDIFSTGQFEYTDHETITCTFGTMKMRGKVLGEDGRFIAFSLMYPEQKYPVSEVYELKEP